MNRQSRFEVEKKNDSVTSVKWATVLTGTCGKKNETFQLNRFLTYMSYFNVSVTYNEIVPPNGYIYNHKGYIISPRKFDIELNLIQIDDCKEGSSSSVEKDNLPVYYRQPWAIGIAINEEERLMLKKSPLLDEWKSEKFTFTHIFLVGCHTCCTSSQNLYLPVNW